MGCCSSKNSDVFNQLAPNEKEIPFPNYISSNDRILEKMEKDYNLFNYMTFIYTLIRLNYHTLKYFCFFR